MGFSISWIAVRGKGQDAVLHELGLTPTGERDELAAESPVTAVTLDEGWSAVIFDRYEHELTGDDVATRVSEGCDAVTAGAEEHVMCSTATGWRNGERLWRVSHDPEGGFDHLEADGSLPEGFEELRRERLAEQAEAGGSQAGVDYVFDVPLDAARSVTGFSHTETEPEDGFAVLRDARSG